MGFESTNTYFVKQHSITLICELSELRTKYFWVRILTHSLNWLDKWLEKEKMKSLKKPVILQINNFCG